MKGIWPFGGGPDADEMADKQRKNFEILANQYRTDATRGAQAIGQMTGAGLNRRGLGDSPLGVGITAQTQNQALQRALGELNKMRSQMEMGIADRQWKMEMREYEDQMGMLQEFIALLGKAYAIFGPDSQPNLELENSATRMNDQSMELLDETDWFVDSYNQIPEGYDLNKIKPDDR